MAYFANGTDGEYLDRQCYDCPLGAGWGDQTGELRSCPVALVQLEFNYSQIGNDDLRKAMNLLISNDGICQVRKELKEIRGAQS